MVRIQSFRDYSWCIKKAIPWFLFEKMNSGTYPLCYPVWNNLNSKDTPFRFFKTFFYEKRIKNADCSRQYCGHRYR